MSLAQSATAATAGDRLAHRADPERCCTDCGRPIVFGENVFTADGAKEASISGMCEQCFDELFDSEDESDFCQGCNPEPTAEELDRGVCASCGGAL